MSFIRHGHAFDGAVRVIAVDATSLARGTADRHGLSGSAARVAAEGAVALGLLSAFCKGDENMSLQLQTESPRCSLAADMDAGDFRARFSPSGFAADPDGLAGIMLVMKSNTERELYRGATVVEGESLASAVRRHLEQSNQVHGLVRLSARLRGGTVADACGLWLERLPEAKGHASLDVDAFEEAVADLRTADLRELMNGIDEGRLGSTTYRQLLHRELRWQCQCSVERVEAMLMGLGAAELRDMVAQDDGAEVTCHFCNESRRFDGARLEALAARL